MTDRCWFLHGPFESLGCSLVLLDIRRTYLGFSLKLISGVTTFITQNLFFRIWKFNDFYPNFSLIEIMWDNSFAISNYFFVDYFILFFYNKSVINDELLRSGLHFIILYTWKKLLKFILVIWSIYQLSIIDFI